MAPTERLGGEMKNGVPTRGRRWVLVAVVVADFDCGVWVHVAGGRSRR